ncbi:MAG: hypothetical protein R3B59_06895 [Dehalococcoidia bacterium]
MAYRLLDAVRRTFEGQPYFHRRSTLGDAIAAELYEDLVELGRSEILVQRVQGHTRVLNRQNTRTGIAARRGDGTFGEILPHIEASAEPGYRVGRAPVATIEIGVEVKILSTAMLKQIDRVIGDLQKQLTSFQTGGGTPVTVGLVPINTVDQYTSYEGDRSYRTGEGGRRHPSQEAPEARRRLEQFARPGYDEFLILPYVAPNEPPFRFEWVDYLRLEREYGAILARVSREYDRRFRRVTD